MTYWSLHYRRNGYTKNVGGRAVPEPIRKVLIRPVPSTLAAALKLANEYVAGKGQRSVGGKPAEIVYLGEYQQ